MYSRLAFHARELSADPELARWLLKERQQRTRYMCANRVHKDKTDPRNTDQWRYACQSCGTPFRRLVSTCGDCGETGIVPLGDLTDIE